MPDGKVTAAGHFHALVCIEVLGAVVAVDMQEECARLRMLLLDKGDSSIEELAAQMLALIDWEDVYLLQFVSVCFCRLHRDISSRLVVDEEQQIGMMLDSHLSTNRCFGVHHVHHILTLFPCDDGLVGVGEYFLRHRPDDRNVVEGCFSDSCSHVDRFILVKSDEECFRVQRYAYFVKVAIDSFALRLKIAKIIVTL